MQDLQGRVAVVTGGSSGIGLGIAKRLSAHGCKTVIVGRNETTLRHSAAEIGGIGLRADVTQIDELHDVARQVLGLYGRIDIVVNNAGIGPTAPLSQTSQVDWRWMLESNLWSVINGIEVFLPILKANHDGGHIVNTASIAGMFTGIGIGAYAATKYAVVALSETLSAELAAEGAPVGVSLFLPGPVRSNIHESGRNRPEWARQGGLADMRLEDAAGFEDVVIPWMEADHAGEIVVEAITSNRLYVWTHPDGTGPVLERFERIRKSIDESRDAIPAPF